MKVSIIPKTNREKQVVKELGNEDWEIHKLMTPVFNKIPSALIEKNNHFRWIPQSQIIRKV